jgi:hypothetical protein
VKFHYRRAEGMDIINALAKEGWRVVAANFTTGDWYALMEREAHYDR